MMRSWSPAVSSCGGAALAATAAARTRPYAKEATERASGPGVARSRSAPSRSRSAVAVWRVGREHEDLVGAQQSLAEQSRDAGHERRRLPRARSADHRSRCSDRESHDGELSRVESGFGRHIQHGSASRRHRFTRPAGRSPRACDTSR